MAFQGYLKEDTATTFRLGAFVDKTDGVTYEVGMAAAMNHATTGVRISKNGGALAARTTATEPVYDAFGYYLVNLDATDVGTVGRLKVIFGDAAVCLPCEADFEILPANVYDSLMGTDLLDVNAAQWLGTAILAPGTAGTPDVNTKLIGGTAQTAGDIVARIVGTIAAGTHNPQSGDAYARIGAAGASLTALGDTRLANLDATVSTRALEAGGNLATILARIIGTLAAGTHNPQTGDSFARIGATGSGLTSLAAATDMTTLLARIIGTLAAGTHSPQSGDSFARIGADGASLTALATATALATVAGYIDTEVASILAAVDTEVAALVSELAKVPKSDSTVTWNATALASILTQAASALTTYGAPTKAEMDAAHALLSTAASIIALTARVPAALIGGRMASHVEAQDNIDFGALQKASIQTAADAALSAAITEPANLAATKSVKNFLWHLYSRFFHKNTQTATQQITMKADGITALATRTVSDDGTTQTLGAAS